MISFPLLYSPLFVSLFRFSFLVSIFFLCLAWGKSGTWDIVQHEIRIIIQGMSWVFDGIYVFSFPFLLFFYCRFYFIGLDFKTRKMHLTLELNKCYW